MTRFEGDFAVTGDGLWLHAQHVAPLDAREPDFVAVAERFLETPYLWGGRTSEGIDCSGLVQTALAAAGVAGPRDSDMMEATLGAPLPLEMAEAGLRRGDLVFWKGHVGIMRDARALLHANGSAMKVTSEPLAAARSRIKEKGGGPVRRSAGCEMHGAEVARPLIRPLPPSPAAGEAFLPACGRGWMRASPKRPARLTSSRRRGRWRRSGC